MLAACAACSAPASNGATPTATGPSAELTIETVAEECERLIATINGGRALVEETTKQAEAAGADELEARARAHESVARGAGEVPFRTPDLQRLAGFYIGVSVGQAAVLRDMNASLKKGDEAALDKATKRFEQLGHQEDVVVDELNLQCRGHVDDAPSAAPPPSGGLPPAPSAPPAGSAPPPSAPPAGSAPAGSGPTP
jgi:hypothetical protein